MTEHKSITHALVAFQASLPDVSKGSTNPAFKSKYADLADITKAVFPELAKHGLAFVTMPADTEHGYALRYELRHTSGEVISGEWPLPEGAKAQEYGSWLTYGRRYCLSAVTGIVADDDDDGNSASGVAAPRVRREPASERVAKAEAALRAATDRETFDKTWDRVVAGGLSGVAPLPAVYAELDGKHPRSTVDAWETKEVKP